MSSETRLGRLWNNPGPDSGWSWVILIAGWFFTLLTFGICRTGTTGVMFVEFLVVFDANRGEAMWPFSILGVCECIGGLLSGAIAESFDCRRILMACAGSCTMAMVLCFWASNLTWITLFFGVLFGLGESISMTICFTHLTHFFKKYLATANGLFLSATPIGGFLMPVIMNALVNMYGLRGGMLLAGGLVMQLLIAAALIRPRTSKHFPCLVGNKKTLLRPTEDSEHSYNKKESLEEQEKKLLAVEKSTEIKENLVYKKHSLDEQVNKLLAVEKHNEVKEDLVYKKHSLDKQAYKVLPVQESTDDNLEFGTKEIQQGVTRILEQRALKNLSDNDKHRTVSNEQKTFRRRFWQVLTIYKTVLCQPMFYVVTVQSVASINILVGVNLVLIDFVMDCGGSMNDGVLTVVVFSISGLAGRLLCGFISDRHYIKDSTIMLAAMFVLTVCLAVLGNLKNSYWCIALAICTGLSEGCTNCLINILYKKYVGQKGLATSLGLRIFTNGVLAFFRPMIAGYFRNTSGSYTNFYYYLASLSLTSGVLWLFEPIFTKTKEKENQEIAVL